MIVLPRKVRTTLVVQCCFGGSQPTVSISSLTMEEMSYEMQLSEHGKEETRGKVSGSQIINVAQSFE